MFARLLDLLFPPRSAEVTVRNATLTDLLQHLAPIPLPNGGAALLPYRTPLVKALVKEAKFRGNVRAQELLGQVLAEYLRDWLPDRQMFEERTTVLIPIPLSRKRYRERGYNQAEEIAKRGEILPVSTHILKRCRDTLPQTSLGKEARKHNMEDAFAAKNPDPTYLYIIVDDVSTTGATLEAAVAALRAQGAVHVVPIALAY